MNIMTTFVCETCEAPTNCRLGLSNRAVQPMRFNCATCGAPIDITLTMDAETVEVQIEVENAKRVVGDRFDFDAETNFVNLHLDFPVSSAAYQPGATPFMMATQRVSFAELQMHAFRMQCLNELYGREKEIKDLFTLYKREQHALFKGKVLAFLEADMPCDTPLDVNRALYFAVEKAFLPFADPERNADAVHSFAKMLEQLEAADADALAVFLRDVVQSRFLKNLQTDLLEIYPRIIDIELMLRPALFLDFDQQHDSGMVPLKVSAHDFMETKDLYKDIAEVTSRALVLVAGMNNLAKRGCHNDFLVAAGAPRDLNQYADMPLGKKLDYIDESWYMPDGEATDNRLRNSIAHYKAEYDEVTQLITYFPRREGLGQARHEQIFLLDYSRQVLLAFRELHRMNHLAKCLFVYYYLRIQAVPATPLVQWWNPA